MRLNNLMLVILILAFMAIPASAVTYTDAIGVKWNTSSSSPTLTRVWANGTTASVDGDYFNNHATFGGMKKVLVNSSTGVVSYGTNNRGDGLDLNGTLRTQVMVEIPLFYTFESYNAPFMTYLICPTQYNASFTAHPMFYQRGTGTPASYYYVGAYEMQNETIGGTNYGTSYTNKTPLVSQTIGQFRTIAQENGQRWGLTNVWTSAGLRELFYIEMATLNSQVAWSKSRGRVDSSVGLDSGANQTDTNIFSANATGSGTGTNGYTPVVWRGMQDLWGNRWEFCDGRNVYVSGGNYIWNTINRTGVNTTGGQTSFQSILLSTDTETATTSNISGGYATSISNAAADRLAMITTGTTGGSSTTYLSDYFYAPTASQISSDPAVMIVSGGWDSIDYAGINLNLYSYNSTMSSPLVGTRLEYRPLPLTCDFSSFKTTGTAPFTTLLYDLSTNLNSKTYTYYWNFGDGNTSSSQSPYYTWNITGTYDVQHSISDSVATGWANKTAYVTVGTAAIAPVASFYGGPQLGNPPMQVFFTDVSSNTPTSWFWDFGDGTNSTSQNPAHYFNRSGLYRVNLTATNTAGSNMTSQQNFVMVY